MQEDIKWEALEYEHRHRSPDWYWALGIIALSGAVAAIIFGNILFGILILIASFTMALFAARPPKMVSFEIGLRGVRIGKTFYPYTTLHSFYVETGHEGHTPAIYLRSKKPLSPHIVLPLPPGDPHLVRDFLLVHLHEEEHHDSFAEHFLAFFGF